ncbi:MAG: amino acid racemase [Chitinophagaceae bacterium]|nr:amino acid racemase [Chitinophagaceae bacterium]
MKDKKIIGILGGMGPAATVNFFDDIVKISQEKYGAEQDTDFPIVYLYNTALEGFNETGFEDMDLVKKQLINDVKKLAGWGADFIVMPCNTVHYFIDDLRASINIPILSIIESTIAEVNKMQYKKVGIISSASTRHLGLYENKLKDEKIMCIVANEDEQSLLDKVILSVMSGKQGEMEKEILKNIIKRMGNDGAEVVILGCTELPLAININDSDLPLLNTIKILAENAVDYSFE